VSQSIKQLERELGATLLHRSRKGTELTDVGEAIIPYALSVLSAEDRLRQEVEAYSGLHRGRLRLGTVAAASNTILPRVLTALNRRYPAVEVRVTDAGSLDVIEGLLHGALDIAFISYLPTLHELPEALEAEELFASRLVVCAPRGHPILRDPMVRVKDLERQRLIMFRRGYLLHDLLNSVLDVRAVNIAYYAASTEGATRMIAAGVGVSVLPECSVLRDPYTRSGQIQYRPVTDMPTSFRICVARFRMAPMTSLQRAFLELVRREAPAFR
jgi:DNA-binding transcriptional LysR family regulator